MITGKEDVIDIKENNYYWYYSNDTFKLIKIVTLIDIKEIIYKEIVLLDQGQTLKMIEYNDDKRIPYKEKTNMREYNPNELSPRVEDLSSLSSISYPAILYNFKLKNDLHLNTARAGKLNIGLNLTKANTADLDSLCNVKNFDMLENNTIIINGLPSTGKTILTKRVIDNLNVENRHLQEYISFLELFGNCIDERTADGASSFKELNENSSRYQRVVKLYFNKFKGANKLLKIKVKHYLCEKNRVVEGWMFNFHIFHLIIQGLYTLFKKGSHMPGDFEKIILTDYAKLNETGLIDEFYKTYNTFPNCTASVDFDEYYMKKFNGLLTFTKKKGIGEKIIKNIFNLVIGMLLLNHIDFDIDQEGKAFIHEHDKIICQIAEILECDKTILIKRLISREYRSPRGSFYVTKLSKEDAKNVKDTYIKYLYEYLFNFMTKYINLLFNEDIRVNSLNLTPDEYDYLIKEKKSIKFTQVVECFGFENNDNPQKNSLENLLINYTNDKLNNLLFDNLLRGEVKLYQEEGILNDEYEFMKNKSTAKRISTKINYNKNNGFLDIDIENTMQACEDENKGIFKLIDVQGGLLGGGSVKALCDNIKLNWPNLTTTSNSFWLVHFGKVVEYAASDFIIKNIDTVNDDLKDIAGSIFKTLTNEIIGTHNLPVDQSFKYLYTDMEKVVTVIERTSVSGNRNSVTRKIAQNMKLKSNSEQYLISLKKLLTKITKSRIYYIKLINTASNGEQYKNNGFDDRFVLKQIYSSGILESVLIAKRGFFLRENYEELIKRLSIFDWFKNRTNVPFINNLADLLEISTDDFVKGKSMLFLKNSALDRNRKLIALESPSLSSYAITHLLNLLLSKFMRVLKVYRYFANLGKKAKVKLFTQFMDNAYVIISKKRFLKGLAIKKKTYVNKVRLLQKHFKGFVVKTFKEKEFKAKVVNLVNSLKLSNAGSVFGLFRVNQQNSKLGIFCTKLEGVFRKSLLREMIWYYNKKKELLFKAKVDSTVRIQTMFRGMLTKKNVGTKLDIRKKAVGCVLATTKTVESNLKRLFFNGLTDKSETRKKAATLARSTADIVTNSLKMGFFSGLKTQADLRKNTTGLTSVTQKLMENNFKRIFLDKLSEKAETRKKAENLLQKTITAVEGGLRRKFIDRLVSRKELINNTMVLGTKLDNLYLNNKKSNFFESLRQLAEIKREQGKIKQFNQSKSLGIITDVIEGSLKRSVLTRLKTNSKLVQRSLDGFNILIYTYEKAQKRDYFYRFIKYSQERVRLFHSLAKVSNTVNKAFVKEYFHRFMKHAIERDNLYKNLVRFGYLIDRGVKSKAKKDFLKRLLLIKEIFITNTVGTAVNKLEGISCQMRHGDIKAAFGKLVNNAHQNKMTIKIQTIFRSFRLRKQLKQLGRSRQFQFAISILRNYISYTIPHHQKRTLSRRFLLWRKINDKYNRLRDMLEERSKPIKVIDYTQHRDEIERFVKYWERVVKKANFYGKELFYYKLKQYVKQINTIHKFVKDVRGSLSNDPKTDPRRILKSMFRRFVYLQFKPFTNLYLLALQEKYMYYYTMDKKKERRRQNDKLASLLEKLSIKLMVKSLYEAHMRTKQLRDPYKAGSYSDSEVISRVSKRFKTFFRGMVIKTVIKELKDSHSFLQSLRNNSRGDSNLFSIQYNDPKVIDEYFNGTGDFTRRNTITAVKSSYFRPHIEDTGPVFPVRKKTRSGYNSEEEYIDKNTDLGEIVNKVRTRNSITNINQLTKEELQQQINEGLDDISYAYTDFSKDIDGLNRTEPDIDFGRLSTIPVRESLGNYSNDRIEERSVDFQSKSADKNQVYQKKTFQKFQSRDRFPDKK
jgi:hypothetical protein